MKRAALGVSILLLLGTRSIEAQNCNGTSTGRVPLTDLGAGTYQGSQGGLYPGGSNVRPAGHEAAGLAVAASLVPLDATGNPDPTNGIIGFASLGMSNTTQEFQEFLNQAGNDPQLDPQVVFVDGAQGGKAVDQWADPNDTAWTTFANRLSNAGVAPAQLKVVWIKQASRASSIPSTFPAGPQQVQAWLRQTVLNLKSKYPSVVMVYLSSRIYAGYATSTLSPEPPAYETGFAVKWLIEDQINGDAVLSDPAQAPWLSWGAYLWADGLGSDDAVGGIPGRSDGLEWLCSEFASDGTHPGTGARQKVAQMLLTFLKTDSTSSGFVLAGGSGGGGGGGGGSGNPSGSGKSGCGATGLEVLLLLALARRRQS